MSNLDLRPGEMDRKSAARYLGIAASTVTHRTTDGRIRSTRSIGHRPIYHYRDLDESARNINDRRLNLDDAAAIIDVPRATLYSRVRKGDIAYCFMDRGRWSLSANGLRAAGYDLPDPPSDLTEEETRRDLDEDLPSPEQIALWRSTLRNFPPDTRLSLKRAAAVLGISRGTLRREIESGRIPGAEKHDGFWRIPVSSILPRIAIEAEADVVDDLADMIEGEEVTEADSLRETIASLRRRIEALREELDQARRERDEARDAAVRRADDLQTTRRILRAMGQVDGGPFLDLNLVLRRDDLDR